MMLFNVARDINILSIAFKSFRKHPKIKFRMLTEIVLISFIKPEVRKTLNTINLITCCSTGSEVPRTHNDGKMQEYSTLSNSSFKT